MTVVSATIIGMFDLAAAVGGLILATTPVAAQEFITVNAPFQGKVLISWNVR